MKKVLFALCLFLGITKSFSAVGLKVDENEIVAGKIVTDTKFIDYVNDKTRLALKYQNLNDIDKKKYHQYLAAKEYSKVSVLFGFDSIVEMKKLVTGIKNNYLYLNKEYKIFDNSENSKNIFKRVIEKLEANNKLQLNLSIDEETCFYIFMGTTNVCTSGWLLYGEDFDYMSCMLWSIALVDACYLMGLTQR